MRLSWLVVCVVVVAILSDVCTVVNGATPEVGQALKLTPIQSEVDYDRPSGKDAKSCKISARKFDGHSGWIVEGADGKQLRKFVDTNGDNVVDQWSYYKDGLEVYRDIDKNYNGKTDQYRWFHTGGSRWGIDIDEDGKVDSWQAISAEEVTAEAVAALANADAERFERLVLTPSELKSLGLGKEKTSKIRQMLDGLGRRFKDLAKRQKVLGKDAEWLQFSAGTPGLVPAGTDGSSKDLLVYENVVSIVKDGKKHCQVQNGALIKVDGKWRLIGLPSPSLEGQDDMVGSGAFFRTSQGTVPKSSGTGPTEQTQNLLAKLENVDKKFAEATSDAEKIKLNEQRAAIVEKIANESGSESERTMWLRQLADMVSAATQAGLFPGGVKKLNALYKSLGDGGGSEALEAYIKFRALTADYGLKLREPKADFAKIQVEWLENLEQFVKDYPKSSDAAEAMLQLAMAKEFAGDENAAKQWYGRIVKGFSNSPAGKKAAGARHRLDSVGRQISLRGKGPQGEAVDLRQYKGNIVLVQYWATWCEPCKTDMATLKELVAKYGKSGFRVIGVSLDNSRRDLNKFLSENRSPWPQIYEEGGLDSRFANEMGILTLPTMILVGRDGKVADRNIRIANLEREVKALLKR